jgi:hypothetical protein
MKFLALFITLLLTNLNDNFCTCPPIGNTIKETVDEFNNSNIVVIGEVTKVNNMVFKYEFTICEVFKGDLKKDSIIEGINPRTCNPIVDENGQWLLFGKLIDKNKFVHNNCGLTNSLIKPWKNLPLAVPPDSQKTHKEKIKFWKKETPKIIEKQLELLRKLKN